MINMKKKLLQINVTANWGSHGKIAEDIGRLAISNGWDSYLAYGRNHRESENTLIKVGSNLGVLEHGIESRLFDNHGTASRVATMNLIREINKIGPHIIHLHNIHGYYLNYQILFDYLSKIDIPVIWTLHDSWPFTGHCAYYDYVQCDRWKNGCYAPCPCRGEYPQSLLVDRCRQNWNNKKKYFCSVRRLSIVTVSNWLKEQAKESFLGHYDINVIKNGVDLQKFHPMEDIESLRAQYGLHGKKILLGVANVWTESKGIRDFLRLSETLPDDYIIVMIGLSEKQKNNIPERILALSRTATQEDLAKWYSLADITLNLSYQETFGMTTAESLACGTPGIVYDRTASPEFAEDGICEVAGAGDISKVAEIIRSGRLNKENCTLACRNRAIESYDMRKSYDAYTNLYEAVLSSSEKQINMCDE